MRLNQNSPIVAALDPELTERLIATRRGFFASTALKLGALASAPLLLAMTSQEAFGQALPSGIVDVLKFALTLEPIEDAFYRSGLEAIPHIQPPTADFSFGWWKPLVAALLEQVARGKRGSLCMNTSLALGGRDQDLTKRHRSIR